MDVAARAGVSFKTVSRVLNREAHVRPALRKRVEDAVEELGYRPNPAARQLAGSRSYLIAYLFHKAAVSYFSSMLIEASAQCRDKGYHLVAEPIDLEDEVGPAIERAIRRLRPDGIILTPTLCDNPEALAAIEDMGVPVARIAGTLQGHGTTVDIDDRPVCRALVDHLIELGHRRIAIVSPNPEHQVAQGRLAGYRDALEAAEIAIDPDLIIEGDFGFRTGALAADRLLTMVNPPTAIFASNDGMALGVMSAAQRRGLRIPQDVAIAGFDDTAAGRMHWPPLTSVHQPLDAMARAAVAILTGGEIDQDSLKHRLIVRGSTTGSIEFAADALDA
jgi:LacI family transcriptional regulator